MEGRLHSEEYLSDIRLTWWNADFLRLMVSRWGIHPCSSILDVGCGHGHWLMTLMQHVIEPKMVQGIDKENEWVWRAKEAFSKAFPTISSDFTTGNAESLDIADNSFDVVTCQTLLMHLAMPQRALQEMIRVLKPGGILICIEPNNFLNYIGSDSVVEEDSVESRLGQFEFWLRYSLGKKSLGEGDNAIGEKLLALLAPFALTDIQLYICDKVSPLVPPYQHETMQAAVKQVKEWMSTNRGLFDEAEIAKYVRAGNGSEELLKHGLVKLRQRYVKMLEDIEKNRYYSSSAGFMYLCSGRKTNGSTA
ncbi:MAG TPA: class I SAM-dependent methyltransferase [Chthoniobacterales bacterium]|nr:class I SAM-dependent methyltransferase [Chthoniobacterales bacterium]